MFEMYDFWFLIQICVANILGVKLKLSEEAEMCKQYVEFGFWLGGKHWRIIYNNSFNVNITGVPVHDFVSAPLGCPFLPRPCDQSPSPSSCCSAKVTKEKEIYQATLKSSKNMQGICA